jgi:hypothetical protein
MSKDEGKVFYNPKTKKKYQDLDQFIEELDLEDYYIRSELRRDEWKGYKCVEDEVTDHDMDYKRGYEDTFCVIQHKASGELFGWEHREGVTEFVQDEVLWKGRAKKEKVVSYKFVQVR